MSTTETTTLTAQAREDVKQKIATALPDDEAKAKAGDDLSNHLKSPEVKKQAYESVKSLATTIHDIRKGFISVKAALIVFDDKNYKGKDGNVLKLGPHWEPMIKKFDETLNFSLKQAKEAATFMRTVTAVLGDVAPADGAQLAIELKQFMSGLPAREENALVVNKKFQELADDVILFNAKIDIALEQAEANIKVALESARKRLDDLNKELAVWMEKLNVGTTEMISEIAVGALQAVKSIYTLDFAGIMGAVDSVINIFSHEAETKKKEELEQSIAAVNQEISELLARDQDLGTFRTRLEESKKVVTSISEQILVIVDIWKTIHLDLYSLDVALSSQVKGELTKFFLKKLIVAKEIYQHLTILLETYVEQTNAANPK
ncbi:hypothetical protein B0H16DRAFT_1733831 [Mycena metata]|uniref:Haemolytic enterotoxin (HBL) n=1 Tax=Mycena metata TaxID=1033252 RepID=A0AAD7MS58_9AGAR|nr:hypothetical protein B0H16DRAFT_1733831 [Mycena metata]